MAGINRTAQNKILTVLRESYPNHEVRLDFAFQDMDPNEFLANLRYLWEHGLVAANWYDSISDGLGAATAGLTAKGQDFLADDGGLSAILGVVTVKLHQDSVKALLIDHVDKAEAPDDVKRNLVEKLKALPAEAMQQLTLQALEKGVQNLPDIIPWLLKLLSP